MHYCLDKGDSYATLLYFKEPDTKLLNDMCPVQLINITLPDKSILDSTTIDNISFPYPRKIRANCRLFDNLLKHLE